MREDYCSRRSTVCSWRQARQADANPDHRLAQEFCGRSTDRSPCGIRARASFTQGWRLLTIDQISQSMSQNKRLMALGFTRQGKYWLAAYGANAGIRTSPQRLSERKFQSFVRQIHLSRPVAATEAECRCCSRTQVLTLRLGRLA
jgi:hypothetical protein